MPAEAPDPLSGERRVHIVGIGGAGMSAIATVLAALGHRVTGSDLAATPVTARLEAAGITVARGHAVSHVGEAEVVTASPAVGSDNPEIAEARRRGLPVLTRAEVLASISRRRRTAAVAGTHGKTTTSSMLALALREAGMRPSFLVGADVGGLKTNAAWDDGEWLILEADESYGSFGALEPALTVLTSVEADHLDHYETLGALEAAFGRLLAATTGTRLSDADDPGAARLGAAHGALSVGEARGADYAVTGLELGAEGSRFALAGPEGPLGRVCVAAPGRHNVANAALAAAAATEIGAPFDAVAAALARFTGAPRRFERRGEAGGVTFVDDYGHLPGEIRPTIAAARLGAPGRLVAVFQPHRYTRTALLAPDFGPAFAEADVVVVTDVYPAGEPPLPGVSGLLVADAVAAARGGRDVHYAASRAELVAVLGDLLAPGDLCLTLGAGDLTTLPDELRAVLGQ
jgi:UDP-N-acetylmuramate--alanine ligase